MRSAILGAFALAAGVVVLVGAGGASGVTKPPNTWAGTWNTNYGKMVLGANGSGTYEQCGGVINGTVSGNKLAGTWTQKALPGCPAEQSGRFEFTMAAAGRSWSGWWNYTKDTARRGWAGACIAGPCMRNGEITVVEFSVYASANNRRVSIYALGGAGVLDPDGSLSSGHPMAYEERPNAWNPDVPRRTVLLRVVRGELTVGANRRLDLTVEVVSSGVRACPRGARGTVTLIADSRRRANGKELDYAAVRCGSLSRSWTNADDSNMYPSQGGLHGGQWASVGIKF